MSFSDRIVRAGERARRKFIASGFEIPNRFIEYIESVRQREDGECDFQFYLDEVLREYTKLRYPWQPKVRVELSPCERSAYLDKLAARADEDSRWLDLNYEEFLRLRHRDYLQWSKRVAVWKELDFERHREFLQLAISHNPSNLVAAFCAVAENFGYSPVGQVSSKPKTLQLRKKEGAGTPPILNLPDLVGTYRRGGVIVQYFFDERPEKPFGLSSFVPGGYIYYDVSSKDILETCFSFFAQCHFAADLDISGVP